MMADRLMQGMSGATGSNSSPNIKTDPFGQPFLEAPSTMAAMYACPTRSMCRKRGENVKACADGERVRPPQKRDQLSRSLTEAFLKLMIVRARDARCHLRAMSIECQCRFRAPLNCHWQAGSLRPG